MELLKLKKNKKTGKYFNILSFYKDYVKVKDPHF